MSKVIKTNLNGKEVAIEIIDELGLFPDAKILPVYSETCYETNACDACKDDKTGKTCLNIVKLPNNKINYFLNWYRLEVSDNINDFKDEDYDVHLLTNFVNDYLCDNDYTNTQTIFFDVEYFIQTCMDDGYDVYVNKGGVYKSLSQKEITQDYISMSIWDGRAKYMTEYDMFIIKQID
jgi:hypothetical protein